ncbi:MAG TPA: DUF72 domain-containing protein [Rhodanobacteraceae bacterium]|nr:DUF72 domain-containing protein [Rhodanobacteraceae bacterium]
MAPRIKAAKVSGDPAAPARTPSRIRAGTGGWTYAPWRDNFYPAGLVQRRELEYASRHLTAIEINGTFYGAQKPASYAAWRAQTPDGFVFSLKAPRYATERKELAGAGSTIKSFVFGGLAELGDRLGPINWQLPATKRFERDDLAAFFDLLPRELDGRRLRHVIEVRDASFADPAYVELARSRGVATVFTDSPDYPSIPDVTGDFVYARLRCCESAIPTGYAPAALDAWARRADVWMRGGEPDDLPRVGAAMPAAGERDVFVYFINGAKERAPAAAMTLLDRIEP